MAVSEGGQCPRTVDRIDRAWLEGEGTLAIRARDDAATAKAALDAFLALVRGVLGNGTSPKKRGR